MNRSNTNRVGLDLGLHVRHAGTGRDLTVIDLPRFAGDRDTITRFAATASPEDVARVAAVVEVVQARAGWNGQWVEFRPAIIGHLAQLAPNGIDRIIDLAAGFDPDELVAARRALNRDLLQVPRWWYLCQLITADTWRQWNETAVRHHYHPTPGFGPTGLLLGDIAKAHTILDAGPLAPTVITIPPTLLAAGTALDQILTPPPRPCTGDITP